MLASNEQETEASTYKIEGLPEGMCFNAKYLLMVESSFKNVHFDEDANKAYFFGENFWDYVARLNGIKKLVMGNHDNHETLLYLKYFTRLYGCMKLRNALFSHAPVHPNQWRRFPLNIHGHMHAKSVGDPSYICVSVEQTNLAPVLLDTVLLKAPK